MDSSSIQQSDSPKPERLKTLASNVKFPGGNLLLHQFVLDNSHPNVSGSEIYTRAVMLSMSDAPKNVVNALNDEGFTALHLAVLKSNLSLVTKLLSFLTNIDVNARSGRGLRNTALHLAVELGHISIVQELFNKGASIVIRNGVFETALSVAMGFHDLDTVKVLVSANVNQHYSFNTPLHEAVFCGSLEIVVFLTDKGADLDARDGEGRTPLHDAAFLGNLEIAEFLIDHGADINARDGSRITPLREAAESGSLDIVKLLVGKGADLNATDKWGRTPLCVAAIRKNSECASFLLDQGAHIHADVDGCTPLHGAAWAGHVDLVRALLDKGADVNARNADGKTPLDLAIEQKNQSCIDALQNVR